MTISGKSTIDCNSLFISSAAIAFSESAVATVIGTASLQAQNLSIGPSNVISANGGGYTGHAGSTRNGLGPGAGLLSGTSCGGAGHGGSGGGVTNIPGGVGYGSTLNPTDMGSSGCAASTTISGGAGGGIFRASITDTFSMEGLISVNGLAGSSAAGGGSGGSITVNAGSLVGSGTFTANGGAGSISGGLIGGGGAGGRIAIIVADESFMFTGAVSSVGGVVTAAAGGPGTIYIQVFRSIVAISNFLYSPKLRDNY